MGKEIEVGDSKDRVESEAPIRNGSGDQDDKREPSESDSDAEETSNGTRNYAPNRGFRRYNPALRNLIPVRRSKKSAQTDHRNMPVDDAGLFSVVTFSWLSKYMYKAYSKGLDMSELPAVSPYEACEYNVKRLEFLWKDEVARKGSEKASFGRIAWLFVRTRVLASTLVFSCSILFAFLNPIFVMRKLLEHVQSPEKGLAEGLKWAFLMILFEFLRVLFFTWTWALNYRTALRLRAACLSLLYRKIIGLNHLGNTSSGMLTNIFANDGQRIFDMIVFAPMMIGGPIVTVCGIWYILWLLGPMALFGMLVFTLFYPLQYVISRVAGYLRSRTLTVSDARVRLTNEILECIKLIKMYAWEKHFRDAIVDIRKKEQGFLLKTTYCQNLSHALAPTVPVISAIVTFLAHLSTGQNLLASQAFPVSTFFGNQIRQSLSRIRDGSESIVDAIVAFARLKVFSFIAALNRVVRQSMQSFQIGMDSMFSAIIAIDRIKTILLLEDGSCPITKPIVRSQAVAISHGTFAYDVLDSQEKEKSKKGVGKGNNVRTSSGNEEEKARLKRSLKSKRVDVLFDVTFEAGKGKLIGICGHVGSGKSSLLLAALGQLRLTEGQVMRDGSCAYVSQQAWIVNATLRDNILFGERFDAKRYYKALHVCNLNYDINAMPGGDETEIGERGINLSGGQKQRVALARALYAGRDIYFLDDPLSAVDAHVGLHIFDNLIQGALHDKTVLFVTHQIQYLNRCDDVYMMRDGRIVEHGTHDELMKLDQEYALMVNAILNENPNTTTSDEDNEILGGSDEVMSIEGSLSHSSSKGSQMDIENTDKVMNPNTTLTMAERTGTGKLKAHTYFSYVSAAGGYFVALVVFFITFINIGSTAFSSWWIAQWLSAGGGNVTDPATNTTIFSDNINDNPDFNYYQTIYGSSIGIILSMNLLRSYVFSKSTIRASTRLHNQLFNKIMTNPMRFFDTTPSGRIQNLFSRDLDEVDYRLPSSINNIIQNILLIFFAFFFICLVFPWFIIPMCGFIVIYYYISKVFGVALRDLKRMENASRSPIFSCITATIQGLGTIHAFEKEASFNANFSKIFDENNASLFLCCQAMRWLAVRIDSLAVVITGITALLVVSLQGHVPPALAGLALSYSAYISGILQYTIRLVSETEMRFISVERIHSYINDPEIEGNNDKTLIKVKPNWPNDALLRFEKVSMSYGLNMPLVLKEVSFTIEPREKIGIVGRTGSGKSSLTVALFRLVELVSGKITIDNVDISEVELDQLRSRLSIIPQDPILFSGTLRSNLDPFKVNSDADVWEALEKTMLKDRVQSIPGQLNATVGFGGDNLSVGERQLLCLTRALLRRAKILVLDEATAAVDPETEIAVQNTIQREFVDSTVLTIAHRLQTVVSCDRILVMDDGHVAEFDTPSNLLGNENSQFSKMMVAAENAAKRK